MVLAPTFQKVLVVTGSLTAEADTQGFVRLEWLALQISTTTALWRSTTSTTSAPPSTSTPKQQVSSRHVQLDTRSLPVRIHWPGEIVVAYHRKHR